MTTLWIATLLISQETDRKIRNRHGIAPDEARSAVERRSDLVYVWDHHPERGRRAIIRCRIRERPALAVLYDARDPLGDVYWLGSIYFTD